MKLSQLKTHWDAGDAHMIISFLDELKEVLWASYGEEIIEMHQSECELDDQENGSGNRDDEF